MIRDYYTDNPNADVVFYEKNWRCATFTAGSNYPIKKVILRMHRDGWPGTITVSIRASTGGAKPVPTGADLCSGTYNGNDLSAIADEDIEFDLGGGTALVSGTVYAIVIRAIDGDGSNKATYRVDSAGGYAGGTLSYSSNSGTSWVYGPDVGMGYSAWFETDDGGSVPVITDQSTDTDADYGDNVNFFITATGDPTPTYQWYKDGSPLSGETNSTLSLSSVDQDDGGTYYCIATNVNGSDQSEDIDLRIAPYIISQTNSYTAVVGALLSLSVTVGWSPSGTYQWYKDDILLPGETSSNLSKYASYSDAGVYKCVVTNGAGSATSANITIEVIANDFGYSLFNLPYDIDRETS